MQEFIGKTANTTVFNMKRDKNIPDWFRPKLYVHFTKKIEYDDLLWVSEKIENKDFISKYSFYPLLHYSICQRRYQKLKDENGNVLRNESGKIKRINNTKTVKSRPIDFCNHFDAQIYSYYTHEVLNKFYKTKLLNGGLDECIIGYRKIDSGRIKPITKEKIFKCNIDFAHEVFTHIRKQNDCIAITYDIKDFFTSLNHEILKNQWCSLINENRLPNDQYNLFKSITNYSTVNEKDLLTVLKIPHKKELRRKKINSYFKNANQFRINVRNKGLIKKHTDKKGIPQGTPISAFLSNIYLFEFDLKIFKKVVTDFNGLYRRYSDDILIICNPENYKEINDYICSIIAEYKLEIQKSKTKINYFKKEAENHEVFEMLDEILIPKIPLQYLGFEFDGKRTLIKSASLAKYYRGMKSLINLKARRAGLVKEKNTNTSKFIKNDELEENINSKKRSMIASKSQYLGGIIFRKKIYKRFSHYGKSNFISYAIRAADIIMNEPAIRKQVAKHWKKLINEINKYHKPHFEQDENREKERINFNVF